MPEQAAWINDDEDMTYERVFDVRTSTEKLTAENARLADAVNRLADQVSYLAQRVERLEGQVPHGQ